ncbi:MAG: hypothetical protein KAG14_01090, partial [Mycoplasmataceae bacterium]|nr:hypothetical protein [Mycoplasmataceae bacterium]
LGDGHIKTNPTVSPEHIYINFKDKLGVPIEDSLLNKEAYVLEWGVFDSNHNPVAWTDSAGYTAQGWHIAHGSASDDTPPSASYPFLGHMPTSLKNGYKVEVRMHPRDGYFIVDNDPNAPGLNPLGYKNYSHTMKFADVSGLKEAINLPAGLTFKDSAEAHGPKEPTFKFTGNEGHGGLVVDAHGMDESSKFKVKVQWFRPYHPLSKPGPYLDTNTLRPTYGLEMYIGKDEDGQNKFIHIADMTNAGLKYLPTANLMRKDSLFDASELDELSVGDTIKFRFVAKDGFAFRWEDSSTGYTDIQIPKDASEHIYSKADNPFGAKVYGLTIFPKINANIDVKYLPSGQNRQPYDGDALIMLTQLPASTDKWIWHTQIINPDGIVIEEIDGLNIHPSNIHIGYKLKFTISPISKSYVLDPAFVNTEHVMIIEGLKTKIDTSDVARPIITFGGVNGEGAITLLTAGHNPKGQQGLAYDKANPDQNGFSSPVTHHLKGNGIKWVFSVSNIDPMKLTTEEFAKIKYSSVAPKNLKIGQWINVHLEPENPQINGIEPPVFAEGTQSQIASQQSGWIQVDSLFVNPDDVGLYKRVIGASTNNRLIAKFIEKTASEEALNLWVKKSGTNVWQPVNKMINLKNGDKLTFRAELVHGAIPDPSLLKYFIMDNGKLYLQKPSWINWLVDGIKTEIDVTDITIETPTFVNDPNVPEVLRKEFPNAKEIDIFNGYANLLGIENILTNAMRAKATWIDSGISKSAEDKIQVEYILSKYDLASNSYVSSESSILPPTHLSNGDKIVIQIVPKDENIFVLSTPLKIELIAKDFLASTRLVSEIPSVSFSGKDGEGWPVVNAVSPEGFKWEYQVYDSKKRIISGAKDFWLSAPPSNLWNHQFIKVRVASNNKFASKISGISAQTGFVEVVGLSEIVNIEDIIFDKDSFVLDNAKNSEGKLRVVTKIKDGLRYIFEIIKKNPDGTEDVSIPQISLPDHLSNGDMIKITIESADKNIQLFNTKIVEFEVKGLEEVIIKSSTSRLLITIIVISGILLTMATAGGYFFLKRRKINKLG